MRTEILITDQNVQFTDPNGSGYTVTDENELSRLIMGIPQKTEVFVLVNDRNRLPQLLAARHLYGFCKAAGQKPVIQFAT